MATSDSSSEIRFLVDATQQCRIWWHVSRDKERIPEAMRDDLAGIAHHYGHPGRPARVVAVFDGREGAAWRKKLLPSYKSKRTVDEGLQQIIDKSVELVAASFPTIRLPDQEADDVLATLAKKVVDGGGRAVIVTRDKDLLQCLRAGKVSVLRSYSRGSAGFVASFETAATILKEYGFSQLRWVEYLAMCGDASDSVVGWTGAGDKRARDLLSKKTLAEWLAIGRANLEALPKWSRPGFADFAERWPILEQILRVREDVPLGDFYV